MKKAVPCNGDIFVPGRVGRFMCMREDELTRYQYEIWFEYTRKAINDIREGTMLAVRNYATDNRDNRYSVLEVTGLRPVHYALGENPSGFPAFLLEAARNASQDWIQQDDRSFEDTTVIRCTAIPTNLEIVETAGGAYYFDEESNIPMLGEEARLLTGTVTEAVVNKDLDPENEDLMEGGTLIRDSGVKVYLRIEDFLKVHFGIFGFTGAGKSNLLSTYISGILEKSSQPVKVLLFDLMSEYLCLFIDKLVEMEQGYLICLGENTLPGPVLEYLNGQGGNTGLDRAAGRLLDYALLPKGLKRYQEQMKVALGKLLEKQKIKVYSPSRNMTVYELFYGDHPVNPLRFRKRTAAQKNQQKQNIIKAAVAEAHITDWESIIDSELAKKIGIALKKELEKQENKEFNEGKDFDGVLNLLRELYKTLAGQLKCNISEAEILNMLDDERESGLFVIISHDPHELRSFAHRLGNDAYEQRRQQGRISPLVSFVFDEADEFIRSGGGSEHESYQKSREIAHTLARRGRKFGLGLGIATQRIRYLDTSIMAQPHTYLVSKLPRRTDREAVADAFGIPEELFRQTFTFAAGNWLLISHDATGLKAVPVPIKTADANARIAAYLESMENSGTI